MEQTQTQEQRNEEIEERLKDFIVAFNLIKSSEINWKTQEIVLSFNETEEMIPFIDISNTIFAMKNKRK